MRGRRDVLVLQLFLHGLLHVLLFLFHLQRLLADFRGITRRFNRRLRRLLLLLDHVFGLFLEILLAANRHTGSQRGHQRDFPNQVPVHCILR